MKNIDLSIAAQNTFKGDKSDPEVPDLLELIASLTPKVNAATDKVNALIRTVEKTLNDVGAGVFGFATIDMQRLSVVRYSFEPCKRYDEATQDDIDAHDIDRNATLLYDRTPGGYRIVLREGLSWIDGDDSHFETLFEKPLLECPRDKKLYATFFLAELLFDIAQRLDSMREVAEKFAADERLQSAVSKLTK